MTPCTSGEISRNNRDSVKYSVLVLRDTVLVKNFLIRCIYGASEPKRDLVFERGHAVVFAEAAAEERVAHSEPLGQRLEIDDLPEVVGDVEIRPSDGDVVRGFSVAGGLAFAQRGDERGGFERESVGMLGACRLDFPDERHKVAVEASVGRDSDDRGRLRKERL